MIKRKRHNPKLTHPQPLPFPNLLFPKFKAHPRHIPSNLLFPNFWTHPRPFPVREGRAFGVIYWILASELSYILFVVSLERRKIIRGVNVPLPCQGRAGDGSWRSGKCRGWVMALREGPGMGHGAQGSAGDGSWRSGKCLGWVMALR